MKDVLLLNAKGSVTTWELTASFNESELYIRAVDITRYTNETARAEDVSFELTKKSEGSGALLTYGLTANGLVSSDRGTSGEVVNVRSDYLTCFRVIGPNRDGGYSLNGAESYASIKSWQFHTGMWDCQTEFELCLPAGLFSYRSLRAER